MFCDLVGSTALSAQLDPEELREVVRGYQETCTAVTRRYDGHVAQHLGDGLLVYFGYPVAHEDDAARAVRAGLEIIEALQQFSSRHKVPSPRQGEGQGEVRLQVRIGIHTGLVVIGEIGSSEKREMLALGETPNIAARIQGTANPDEVMISAATYRLVEGMFACEDRGHPELKGVATPLTLYRVIKESEAHSRFEVVVRKGLTPLVGRDHEFGLLCDRWQQVKDGAGQVVLLSGEPGIGKSRLVEALKETVEDEGTRCLELHCSPYAQNSALQPVIEHLQRTLQFRSEDSADEKLQKLEERLSRSPLDQQDAVPLFASLLSLPAPRFPLPAFSPQKQKEKTYEVLVAWLCAEAKQQAVTYVWEDLHWADPSTLELLTLFLNQVPTTRLLTVLTFRPEFVPPWGAHSYLSQLTLSRLGRNHVEAMVGYVIAQTLRPSTSSGRMESASDGVSTPVRAEPVEARGALSSEIIQQIVNKTDGVPLFVEELTKTVLESVASRESRESQSGMALQAIAIPATLQDSLMARLDRLGPAKEIAQLGATLGREFTYELLHAVSPLHEERLQQSLRQLVETELVFQSGVPPQARYLFKHALVQDTAYQLLLKSRRQQLHQMIGKVLEEQFPQTVEIQPELVAHHYTEAGLTAQAIPYWQRAGERASKRSAHVEAISHLNRGLELLRTLSDTPERAQQELTLQLALGAALFAGKGLSAPEVEKTYTRARVLCQQLGETPQLFPVLYNLAVFYRNGGKVQTALELGEQCFSLAQSVQDQYLLSLAHDSLGWTLYFLGELTSARLHVEQAIALYDPQRHPHSLFFMYDPRVVCLSNASWTVQHLGYPDQALRMSREAVALARGWSHPYWLANALGFAAWFHLLRRDGLIAQERAGEVMTLSTEHGFPLWLAQGTITRVGALAQQGQVEECIVQMQQGLTAVQTEVARPFGLALLAEAYGKMGQTAEGLSVLAEALAFVNKTGVRYYEAELYRLKGELTLKKSGVRSPVSEVPNPQHPTPSTQAEAEECFLKAIEIARKQQAKSLELRAVMSLSRLWQSQGKKAEAHKLLADVYNWFTEGFDTKDLQEAKALLESLA